ncbi:hypothetical protein LT330_010711 [Penicillium expansum]|nr:hypothetical protein LT330_010711 [Penicillium expansum]
MAAQSSETLSEMLPTALETLVPGLSLFTRLLSLYSRVEVSTFSSYILCFTLLSAFFKFAVPQLYNNLQKVILYFAASIDIKFESSLHNPLIKWASENKEDDTDKEYQDDNPAEEQRRFEKDKRLFWQSQRKKGRFQPISYTPGQNQLHVFHAETITIFASGKRILIELLEEVQEAYLKRKGNRLFQELPSHCILLLEDIDNAGISQPLLRKVYKSDEVNGFSEDRNSIHSVVSLSALLNCLDGIGAQEGRILIMTTNHPDKLDAALTRPGRVDKKYWFGYADRNSIESIFLLVYKPFIDGASVDFTSCKPAKKPEDQPAKTTANKTIRGLSMKFAELVPAYQFTAAEIQSYLLDLRDDPVKAVRNAADWVKANSESAR